MNDTNMFKLFYWQYFNTSNISVTLHDLIKFIIMIMKALHDHNLISFI